MATITLPTWSYRQFDADLTAEVPAEGYGGWQRHDLPLAVDRTALVVMHAWDAGTPDEFPGWFRAVEYLPRSYEIAETVLPPVLAAARTVGMPLVHVVAGVDYWTRRPGFLGGAPDAPPVDGARAVPDPIHDELRRFRADTVFPGQDNQADIAAGRARMDFHPGVAPVGDEPIAATSADLLGWCARNGINHLVYTGFAINGCLWTSPGGMVDAVRQGYLCSTIRQGVTAIENRETARTEAGKENALWAVAVLYGFVYDVDDFTTALRQRAVTPGA